MLINYLVQRPVSCWGIASLLALCPLVGAEPEPVKPEKKSHWKHTATMGITLAQGNSETALGHLSLLSLRTWELNEFSAKVNGSYGKSDGVKNNETLHGALQYNRNIGEKKSFFYARVDTLHDAIADIEYRLSASPGYGYHFLDNDRFKLSFELGPGFITEKLGSGDRNSYLTTRVGQNFEWRINERSRIWQSTEWLPQVSDFTNFIVVSELGVESKLTSNLNLRVMLQDNFDNQPSPGRKSNDLRLITGLSYSF